MRSFRTICCARIQQRWVFAVMGSLAIINGYAMRVCLSIAITEMVEPVRTSPNQTSDQACPADPTSSMASTSGSVKLYEWDEYTQGLILSSFYCGYILTQIPGALLSARYGAKYVVGVGISLPGIFTILTPVVVENYGSTGLIVLRFVMGVGEGTTLPAIGALIGQWAPPSERTKISTMVLSGIPIGTVIGTALSGVLIEYSSLGWPIVFYFFGACSILWFFAWVVLCHSHPEEHPFISEREKKYLQEAMSQHTQRQSGSSPWRQILASGPLRAMVVGHIGFSWGTFMMVSDLPKYMSNVLRFSIQTNGFLSALPHISTWVVSNASSWLADWLIKREKMSRTNVRKVMSTTAAVLSSVFLVAASYAGCDRTLVVIFFTLGMGMMGFFYPSLMVNPNDLSPNFSGTLMAFVGTIASITGTLAPCVVGLLTPNQALSEWRSVFWITSIVGCGSSVVFAIWGSGEIQSWNNPEPEDLKKVEIGGKTASNTVQHEETKESDEKYRKFSVPA